MACREGCKSRDHASYGECVRAAGAAVVWGMQSRKRTANELAAYKSARDAGIQPAGTTQGAVDIANATSDKYGAAFNAEDGTVGGKAPALIEAGL